MANRQAIVPTGTNTIYPIYVNEKPPREAITASAIYLNEDTITFVPPINLGKSSPTFMLMGV